MNRWIKAGLIAGAAVTALVGCESAAYECKADSTVTGEGVGMPRGSTNTAFGGTLCDPPSTCYGSANMPFNVDVQAAAMQAQIDAHPDTTAVAGYSLSAAATHELIAKWVADPDDAPNPEQVRIITLGNPYRKYGGSDLKKSYYEPLPENQPYQHLDVALRYDPVADKAARPNFYSAINAQVARHMEYDEADLNDPHNLVRQEGNTTYMLAGNKDVLPMLRWRDWFTSDERMAELDAKYRPKIEKAYDRPEYTEQGEGADWANGVKPTSLRKDPDDPGTADPETARTRTLAEPDRESDLRSGAGRHARRDSVRQARGGRQAAGAHQAADTADE